MLGASWRGMEWRSLFFVFARSATVSVAQREAGRSNPEQTIKQGVFPGLLRDARNDE